MAKKLSRYSVELPQVLIQHIQSLLSQKQAAQTVILSKAWLNAWSSERLYIDLDELSFKGTKDEFLSLLSNTFQRNHDDKLCIHSIKLRLLKFDSGSESFKLLQYWLPLVISGVKIFHLNIEGANTTTKYYLPREVIQAKSIVELSLTGCGLDHSKICTFRDLIVLKLREVHIEEKTFKEIMLWCSSIRDMELVHCEGLRSIRLDNLRLETFNFVPSSCVTSGASVPSIVLGCSISYRPGSLESLYISSCKNWFPVSKYEAAVFPNLKILSLTKVSLSPISCNDFSCYFPCLESLTLVDCYDFEEISVSCHLLKYLTLRVLDRSIKGRIDAPNFYSFEYSGNVPSLVTFAKTRNQWNSHIDLELGGEASLVWLKLNEMLKELSQSEKCLSIFKRSNYQLQNNVVDFTAVEVEEVTLDSNDRNSLSIINSLFGVCRPKIINVYWYGYEDGERKRESNDFVEYVCNTIMERKFENSEYLKEVRMSIYDHEKCKFRPLHGTSLRKCGMPNDQFRHDICFELEWICTIE